MSEIDSQQADAASVLSETGALAQVIDGFAPRDVQMQMAQAVEEAIACGSSLVVEAGTGTGKTFAYLVPALLSGKRIIISTGTKTLQDQLYHRDLPRIRSVLGVNIQTALLKGRANYLCWYRLDKTVQEGGLATRAEVSLLQRVRTWASSSASGDISEAEGIAEDASIWPRVTSTTENCLGQTCPMIADCFVLKARRAAQEADLLVVNHHLLFADLSIKREGFGEILPGAHAFILDEAHQIPELAGQFFSISLSSRQLVELEADSVRECAAVSGGKAAIEQIGKHIERSIKELRLALQLCAPRGAWSFLREAEEIKRAIELLAQSLQHLTETVLGMAERSDGLQSCLVRAEALLSRLHLFQADEESGWVHWYELSERGFVLTATPLDIAPTLTDFRRQTGASWIFTSATLAVAGRFEHFYTQMGLDQPTTLCLPSPFDYQKNALCYLPKGLPDPKSKDYTTQVIARVREVLALSQGRAFLLFTSHRALKVAAELLCDLPYPLFVQGTQPRGLLLQNFRASGNGVLLGAASFWEGVDVRGEALSLVVIDKLPFAAPDDPVLEARLKAVRDQGGNPFFDVQIPAAAIALKQGSGRLIRDINDRGVLMLCDPRLRGASYGRLFLASLPNMTLTQNLNDVAAFYANKV
jgi:ATP-dependent DNA helicase DinG